MDRAFIYEVFVVSKGRQKQLQMKERRLALIFLWIHLIDDFIILVLPNYFRELFAWRPFDVDIPVMAVVLLILLASGGLGVYWGSKAWKSGVRDIYFKIVFGIGAFSTVFWLWFMAMEVISPH